MKRKAENQLFIPPLLECYELEERAVATIGRRAGDAVCHVQKAATIRAEVEARQVIRDRIVAHWQSDTREMTRLREDMLARCDREGFDPADVDGRLETAMMKQANERVRDHLGKDFPFLTTLELLRSQGPRELAVHYLDLMVSLAATGEQTFRVFPDLAEGLVRTRIRAPRSRFRLPYQSLEILLPPEIGMRAQVPDGAGRFRPMRSIVVSAKGWGRGSARKDFTLEVTAMGRRAGGERATLAHVVVPLRGLVFDVDADAGEMIDERALRAAALRYTDAEVAREQSTWKALRLAVNLILYVNSEEADVAPAPKTRAEDELAARDRKKGRKVRPRGARVSNVGRKVRLPGIRGGDAGDGTGPKLKFRHWVRGHWHLYRVGEGRESTVMKWVAPYEKGKGRGLPRLYGRTYEADVPA